MEHHCLHFVFILFIFITLLHIGTELLLNYMHFCLQHGAHDIPVVSKSVTG